LLTPWLNDPVIRLWAARLGLFLFVLIIGGVLGLGLGMLMHQGGLSAINRFIGTFFGLARGVVLVAFMLVLLEMAGFSQSAWWQQSKLIPYAAPVTDELRKFAREGLDYISTTAAPAVSGLPEGSDSQ
jgi:membrane protein required for colicin V production